MTRRNRARDRGGNSIAGRTANPAKVVVVGAGLAGCVAAWQLAGSGHHVEVVEAAPRIGGRIESIELEGDAVEAGAVFVAGLSRRVRSLIDELGLAPQLRPVDHRILLADGGRFTRFDPSLLGVLRHPWLSWTGRLRALGGLMAMVGRGLRTDLADPSTMASLDTSAFGPWAAGQLGPAGYRFLVRPAIDPYFFACDEVSRAMGIAVVAAGARDAKLYQLVGGNATLCSRLLDGVPVRLGTEVVGIEEDQGRPVLVTGSGDSTFREVADAVVLATPAPIACALTAQLPDPWIDAATRAHLRATRQRPIIYALFRTSSGQLPEDAAVVVPCRDRSAPGGNGVILIAANRHVAPPGRWRSDEDVIGVYLDANRSEELLEAPDQEVGEKAWVAAQDVVPSLPDTARLLAVHRHRFAAPIAVPGHYRRLAARPGSTASPVQLAGDHMTTFSMEGAVGSGISAAAAISTYLDGARR